MVRTEAAPRENFQIRQLLWDELKLDGRAVEEQELRSAIGSHLVEGNEVRLAVVYELNCHLTFLACAAGITTGIGSSSGDFDGIPAAK